MILGILAVGCGGTSTDAGSPDGAGQSADANEGVDSTPANGEAGRGATDDATADAARDATVEASTATETRASADAGTDGQLRSESGADAVADASAETGASDAKGCGATSCPAGCCDADGHCQPGDGASSCGSGGQACESCAAAGFTSCDAMRRACYTEVAQCATNCRGCCAGDMCFAGFDSNACGYGGEPCQPCASTGLVCTRAAQCGEPCGPATCTGCCVGNFCYPGTDVATCGRGGGQCENCVSTGLFCRANADGGGACGPPLCNPFTCPEGCCDANGVCQLSESSQACGFGGVACVSCPSGTTCDPQRDICVCNSQSCPTGCCAGPRPACELGVSDQLCGTGGANCQSCMNGTPQGSCSNQKCVYPTQCLCTTGCCDSLGHCQPGASNTVCGLPNTLCQDCTLSGGQCLRQSCANGLDGGVCNAQSCPSGCCDAFGQCQQGLTVTVCGNSGTDCQNCLDNGPGSTCANQQCTAPSDAGAGCDPADCPNGCCDALGNCEPGGGDTQCGTGGTRCLDCTKLGGQCIASECVTADGATPCSQSCAGCCDANGQCQLGFANAQCGEAGGTCQDCTVLLPPSNCDVLSSPRSCTSQQSQCPAPYLGCPAPLQQVVPARQKVCAAIDLQNAAAACAAGPTSAPCAAFLNTAPAACSNCLQIFDHDFAAQVGIAACVAPFVDAMCNHASACLADCTNQSCYLCDDHLDPTTTAQCEAQVQSSQCAPYAQAEGCVATALAGPAAVCNPATYQGNFGAWIAGVGAKYCGP